VPRSGWAIGLLQNSPPDLMPYHTSPGDARATSPISQLLFPPPLLSVGYNYTTTGVLETVPTLDNGGAELRSVDVFLDAAGNITTTATEVVSQAQQLVITYRWNPRLRWSDGTPLTAADSVWAYEWAAQYAQDAESKTKLAATERYEVVDEHTTRAVLRPDVLEPTYPTVVWTPLPRHLLQDLPGEQVLSEWSKQPVGYGPYVLASQSEREIVLEPSRYAVELPDGPVRVVFAASIDTLRNEALNGNIDVALSDYWALDETRFLDTDAAAGAFQVTYLPSAVWEHIDFNLDTALLQDIRVRRAVAQAINRQGMVDTLLQGRSRVLDSWLLPEQWAAAPSDQLTRYPFNPDEARRLLDETGLLDSDGDGIRNLADGAPLTLRLLVGESRGGTLRQDVAAQIKADLAAVGIALEVQPVEQQMLLSPEGPLYRRQFDLALFAWMATPDPAGRSLWSCAAVPSERNGWRGENFAGWCFRDADTAIRAATTALDQTERQAAYLQQQQLFTQELPSLPLFQRVTTLMVASNVQGVAADQQAPITWNIEQWTRTAE
jgi:peptide/nickel transport system substrate-binding protein